MKKGFFILLLLACWNSNRLYGKYYHTLNETIVNSVNVYCSSEFWMNRKPYFCFVDNRINTDELRCNVIPSIRYVDSSVPRKALKKGVDIISVHVDIENNQLVIGFQYEVEKRVSCFRYRSEVQGYSRHVYEYCCEEPGWKLVEF